MRMSWWWLKESDFDREAYREDLPGGTWRAVIEQSAWGKKSAGIHLYVRRDGTAERFWIFIPWARHDLYELFRETPDGSRIEVTVRAAGAQKKARLLSATELSAEKGDAAKMAADPRVPRMRTREGMPVEGDLDGETTYPAVRGTSARVAA
jgi:hypothetical protein